MCEIKDKFVASSRCSYHTAIQKPVKVRYAGLTDVIPDIERPSLDTDILAGGGKNLAKECKRETGTGVTKARIKTSAALKNSDTQDNESFSSSRSLDPNMQYFKKTIQEIFNVFYSNVEEIEVYKKRYRDLLTKNDAEAIMEMEEFLIDIIHNIISAESSRDTLETNLTHNVTFDEGAIEKDMESKKQIHNIDANDIPISQSYKNVKYSIESKSEGSEKSPRAKSAEAFNVYSKIHPFETKMKSLRSIMSELKINGKIVVTKILSVDNFKNIDREESIASESSKCSEERDIPVKLSNAKKNIHLNEDFEFKPVKKTFLSKICNYVCKKFCKS